MLVYYIHHITDSIRMDTIMRVVEKGTLATLDRLHPTGDNGSPKEAHDIPPQPLIVGATSSGYVQDYHVEQLAEQARTRNTLVAFIHPIGHHVVRGRPLAHVWPASEDGATAQGDWNTWVARQCRSPTNVPSSATWHLASASWSISPSRRSARR